MFALSELSLLQFPLSFFIQCSILLSRGSLHPSGSVWETVGLELCDCYNFHLTPLLCTSVATWLFLPPLTTDAARLTGKSKGFIGSLNCHGNCIFCNLPLSKKIQQHLQVIFVRCIFVCVFSWECVVTSW